VWHVQRHPYDDDRTTPTVYLDFHAAFVSLAVLPFSFVGTPTDREPNVAPRRARAGRAVDVEIHLSWNGVVRMTLKQTRGRSPDHAAGHRDTTFSQALNAEQQRLGRRLTGAEVNEIRLRIVEKLTFKGLIADTTNR
jgi:hypothetical protein